MRLLKIRNCAAAVVTAVLIFFISICFPYYAVSAANVNVTRTYYVYDNTGAYASSYSLSSASTPTTSSSDASVTSIIGDDNREFDSSLNGIVRISLAKGTYGTGFVVGEHTIATAAHCICDPSTVTKSNAGTYVSVIRFYDKNEKVELTLTDSNVVSVHIPASYVSGKSYSYDYAVITVDEDLSDYMCFNLAFMMDDFINSNTEIYVTGFSYDNKLEGYYRKTGTGYLTSDFTNYVLIYTVDTISGESGAPVYVKTTYNDIDYYSVIGIHTGYYEEYVTNRGTRMNTTLLNFYLSNSQF